MRRRTSKTFKTPTAATSVFKMSAEKTVSAERLHIGFFGMRNAGKSSLINAVTGQELSVVSDVKGTTTDPVKRAMELLPIGPVVIIDTPGLDDEGDLGALRVKRALSVMATVHAAVWVVDSTRGLSDEDAAYLSILKERKVPTLIAYTKSDRLPSVPEAKEGAIYVSAATGKGIYELKETLGKMLSGEKKEKHIVSDLLPRGASVLLVTPIDAAAPKGRLILPQQETLRDLLDAHMKVMVCQPGEVGEMLDSLKEPPALVITDSQAFRAVSKAVPEEIPLTSFSILFARYKGELEKLALAAEVIDTLSPGERILVSEGCTHHRQCGDIGTEKIPAWLEEKAGGALDFTFTSGGGYPEDLSSYKLILHCGGCMLTDNEMKHRTEAANRAGVPILNYGAAIAHLTGVLSRSLKIFQ